MRLLGWPAVIYHAICFERHKALAKWDKARRHADKLLRLALDGFGEVRQARAELAQSLRQMKRFQEAEEQYKRAIEEKGDWKSWGLDRLEQELVECYEAQGKLGKAMEVHFDRRNVRNEAAAIYQCYRKYCEREPSFRLSDERLRELYGGLCAAVPGGRPALRQLSQEDQAAALADMEALGLFAEMIEALSADYHWEEGPSERWLMITRLYERKGDYAEAARRYEQFNLLDRAAPCYERSGQWGKVVLWLLAAGRRDDARELWEKVGRDPEIGRWIDLREFDPVAFEHPLRQVRNLAAEQLIAIFQEVRDWFNAARERLAFATEDVFAEAEADWRAVSRGAGERLDWQGGHEAIVLSRHVKLLPIERQWLYEVAGQREKAAEAAAKVGLWRTSAKSLGGWRWYYSDLGVYLLSGEFFRGGWLVQLQQGCGGSRAG